MPLSKVRDKRPSKCFFISFSITIDPCSPSYNISFFYNPPYNISDNRIIQILRRHIKINVIVIRVNDIKGYIFSP